MTLYATDPRAVRELLTLRTEYAVRTGEVIVPVGDEILMRQTVAEFLDQGQDAEPVYRTVTVWAVDEAADEQVRRDRAREHLLSIAQTVWEEHGDAIERLVEDTPRPVVLASLLGLLAEPLAETAQYSTLGDVRRIDKLVDLLGELTHQERVEDDEVAPGPGEDKQALLEDAERRVNEAADALYGGAP